MAEIFCCWRTHTIFAASLTSCANRSRWHCCRPSQTPTCSRWESRSPARGRCCSGRPPRSRLPFLRGMPAAATHPSLHSHSSGTRHRCPRRQAGSPSLLHSVPAPGLSQARALPLEPALPAGMAPSRAVQMPAARAANPAQRGRARLWQRWRRSDSSSRVSRSGRSLRRGARLAECSCSCRRPLGPYCVHVRGRT